MIVLSTYDTFRFDGASDEDLTGTYIHSDKPVALVSAAFTLVPPSGSLIGVDALIEQLLPLHLWGYDFTLSPFLGRSSGYIYRVISVNVTTTLSISNMGDPVELEGDGEFFEGDIPDDTMVSIISNKPIMVMQYLKSHSTDRIADASMILVPSRDLFVHNITFPVFDRCLGPSTTINLIIACDSI